MTLAEILALLAIVCVVAAAVFDVVRMEIPDTLSVVILVAGLLFGALTPGFDWLPHLAAPVLVFAFGLLAFGRGWLGGGDVKVLTATAVWTGLGGLLPQWAIMAVAGGVLVLALTAVRAALAGHAADSLPEMARPGAKYPYAVAIAAGTLWWAWLAATGR